MKKFLRENYIYILIIVFVVLLKIFIITPVKVNGNSMSPTLKDGDIMLLNKIKYKFSEIKRFDIVVIDYNGDDLIKRVIGLPGEKIEYKNNLLYVNNKKIPEQFTKNKDSKLDNYSILSLEHDIVPDNYYFVVGDNRPNSKDSRMIGFIHKSKIKGQAKFTIFPLSRFGMKK